ncbi:hypothetical protein NAT51_03570 [Flavobacterium amniphilum]|uniref:hypothetical protein n=1 Tax=Flavobacterium amniphilum TaxID=1834035 RepID=UPI00202A56B8|nr:hypothetical protein [Flavobacterium amniphilum]MCL9804585.1 hypothetical protein [Flavobacterium amniphilum]
MTKEVQVGVSVYKPQATIGKLILSLMFDAIGMMTYAIPLLGEAFDIVWAPIAAFALSMLFKGSVGKIGGIVAFIEEIIPGLDIIPTFTLTWLYEYFMDRKNSR